MQPEANWYYVAGDGARRGPVELSELRGLAQTGQVAADTLVWAPHLANWMLAGGVPGLLGDGTPQPPPLPPAMPAAPPMLPMPATSRPTSTGAAGQGATSMGALPKIPARVGLSWTVTFLFFPVGLMALMYSNRVNRLLLQGDVKGAQRASQQALTWAWLSLAFGVVLTVITVWIVAVWYRDVLRTLMPALGS